LPQPVHSNAPGAVPVAPAAPAHPVLASAPPSSGPVVGCGFDWSRIIYKDFIGPVSPANATFAIGAQVLSTPVRSGFYWWVMALSMSYDQANQGFSLAAFLVPPSVSGDIANFISKTPGEASTYAIPTIGVRITPGSNRATTNPNTSVAQDSNTPGNHVGMLSQESIIVPPGWAILGMIDSYGVETGGQNQGSKMHLQIAYAELAIGEPLPQ
jgi:hypothetical protein